MTGRLLLFLWHYAACNTISDKISHGRGGNCQDKLSCIATNELRTALKRHAGGEAKTKRLCFQFKWHKRSTYMLPSFSYLLLAKKKRHFKLTISIYIPSAACHIPEHLYTIYIYVHTKCTRHYIRTVLYQQKYYFQFVSISLMWFGAALQHYHDVYASV